MIDGRHCTDKDLELLLKETSNITNFLFKNHKNDEKNEELQRFLQFLRRFDEVIADSLNGQIQALNGEYEKIISAIRKAVDELKQNVIIDIYEHQ